MPAVAAAALVVVMLGIGLTVIVIEKDFVVSVTEVAVIVAVNCAVTEFGATYVADVVLVFASVPLPDKVQVTPPFFESFDTCAVIVTDCAWSIALLAAFKVTAIGALEDPQSVRKNANTRRRQRLATRTVDVMT